MVQDIKHILQQKHYIYFMLKVSKQLYIKDTDEINLLLLLGVQTSSLIGKAKMKTIKVTGVLILGFFLTWSP